MTLAQKWDFSLYGYLFDIYEGWACPSMSLGAKDEIGTYLVLNSVNIKYWDDPCRENEILAYMVANLINVKVEFLPWFNAWFVNLFGCVFDKIKGLEWPLRKNEILAYMITSLRNKKVNISLDLNHDIWIYLVLYSIKWKYWNDPCVKMRF